jgi:hypothetical protein
MSEGTVRQWCRIFKDGWTYVHDEEPRGQPFVVSDDLVQNVDQKVCERRCFTISEFSCKFPQISHAVLYKIMTVRQGQPFSAGILWDPSVPWKVARGSVRDCDIYIYICTHTYTYIFTLMCVYINNDHLKMSVSHILHLQLTSENNIVLLPFYNQ